MKIAVLEDKGDHRGSSFNVPEKWLALFVKARNVHITTLRPGFIRGNHYHEKQREILMVLYGDGWVFHWTDGKDAPVQSKAFSGAGAALIEIQPGQSHAVKNTGKADLWIVAVTDAPYQPSSSDSFKHILVE